MTVQTARIANVNTALTTGELSQTVDVKSTAISLQTNSPQVSVTIENKVVQELPDQISGQGRQIDDFIFLAPGVTASFFSHRIAGGEDFQNEVLFQGIPVVQSETQGFQSYLNPPFEMVNEFNVASTVFSTPVLSAKLACFVQRPHMRRGYPVVSIDKHKQHRPFSTPRSTRRSNRAKLSYERRI